MIFDKGKTKIPKKREDKESSQTKERNRKQVRSA